GFLTDLLGRQGVFVAGAVLVAVSLALLAAARGYALALVAVVLLSGGWSLLVNVGNVLTPLAFPGSIAFATNLANVLFGLRALLTPLAIASLVRRTSLPAALGVLAGFSLLPAALAAGVDFTALTPAAPADRATGSGGGPRLAPPPPPPPPLPS